MNAKGVDETEAACSDEAVHGVSLGAEMRYSC